MPGAPSLGAVREALRAAYAGEAFIEVASDQELASTRTLEPEGLNDTNRLKLFAFGDAAAGRPASSPCWTTWARAPRARRSRTSIWCWGWRRARALADADVTAGRIQIGPRLRI
jgi:hypothetical protein